MFPSLNYGLQKPEALATSIASCERDLGILLPADLRAFYLVSNGFNELGKGYLVIWSIEELARTDGYEIFDFALQRFLFGSNGSPTAYAFIDGAYVSLPFVASGRWEDEIVVLSTTFDGFFSQVAAGRGS